MSNSRAGNMATIETLETRRMLSAAHPPMPVRDVVGLYDGSAIYSNGTTQTFTVLISMQHGGNFSGTSDDFVNLTRSRITGTVNRRGQVHFSLKPIRFPGTVTGQGKVDAAGSTITATVRVRLGRQTATGTFTLVREPT